MTNQELIAELKGRKILLGFIKGVNTSIHIQKDVKKRIFEDNQRFFLQNQVQIKSITEFEWIGTPTLKDAAYVEEQLKLVK